MYGIVQPIKFVSADSLENEEETVRVGVGLIETGERVIKMKQKENKNKEKMENKRIQAEIIKNPIKRVLVRLFL